ncbi:hypothetical protein CRG98_030398 [Punica granatum]|uniref:Uncharacterized protein n=1 Tax=Punica granatum TaxID=22663 RepID=A0A2I0IYY4_PUNGR|nr:hypothetical protein CRG98_030398 [Punica granatum]
MYLIMSAIMTIMFNPCSRVNSDVQRCSLVQELGDTRACTSARSLPLVCSRAHSCTRHRSSALYPCATDVPRMHARPRPERSSPRSLVPIRARLLAPTPARVSHRASEPLATLVHTSAHPAVRPSSPERATHAPERPSKGSTESPDSQTFLRFFSRIPRIESNALFSESAYRFSVLRLFPKLTTRMWTLVGARMRPFGSRGLTDVHLPGEARDGHA